MKLQTVHRLNIFEPKPQSIRCISFDEFSSRLAVSRSDSSIDIWDVQKNPYLEKIIPGTPEPSVEVVTWCNGRLFSAGKEGTITEYDLETLISKYELSVISGCPIWCMKFNDEGNCLAVGNDEGHVVLHQLSTEGLDFDKLCDKQEGAILCLDWHNDGQIIVTGSIDAIRVWNVNTGQVVNRIMLARESKNQPTVVWCISVISDMTIISGDSCGKISFWDGNTGTLLSENGVQRDDVLSLVVNEEEDVIFASGVDSNITMYEKCSASGNWIRSIQRVVHSHDVRALQIVGEFLVSGGDDCNLVFTKYPPKLTVKFFPFCQKPYCMVPAYFPCLLLTYPNYVEIWSIGTPDNNHTPANMLRIGPKESERIISSSISANATWLTYSTLSQIRLLSLKLDKNFKENATFYKVPMPDDIPSSTRLLLFSFKPTKLIFYAKNIFILKCDSMGALLENTIKTKTNDEVQLMEISNDDTYLACSYSSGKITIYNLHTLEVYCKLPRYKCQATVMKFDPCSENIIVAYSDRKVIEFTLERLEYSWWSKQAVFKRFKTVSFHPIISIGFCKYKVYLQDENSIYVFDRTEEEEVKQGIKKFKMIGGTPMPVSVASQPTYGTITKHEHLSSLHTFMDELILIQISADRVLDCLPPPIFKKKYGT